MVCRCLIAREVRGMIPRYKFLLYMRLQYEL